MSAIKRARTAHANYKTPSMRYESEKVARHLSFRVLVDTGNAGAAWKWGGVLAGSFLLWFVSIGLVFASVWAGIAVWILSIAVLLTGIGGSASHAQHAARQHNKKVDEAFEQSMRRAAQPWR